MRGQGEGMARTSERTRKISARVIGIGMDDAGGHIRFTNEDEMLLFGGSEATHTELQRRAALLRGELERRGISLDGMTAGECAALTEMVERANAPEMV